MQVQINKSARTGLKTRPRRTGSCGAHVAMPLRSMASTRAASQASLSKKFTKPGPAMLVDCTSGDGGAAACIASPTARGFFGAPSCD